MSDQPFFIPAVLFIALSLPLVLGLVPRNRFVGIRNQRAMESDRAWYRINRVGGVVLSLAAASYLLYAWRAPAGPEVVGFDLSHPHFYAFFGPLVLALLIIRAVARRA